MIRKVLLATINYDHPQRGMEAAFRGIFGQPNVEIFDYCQLEREGVPRPAINQMFLDMALRMKPDMVFMQLQETNIISAKTLNQIKTRLPKTVLAHWTGDMRRVITDYLSSICGATDITFASSVGQLEDFKRAGAFRASYMQIGVDFEEDVLGLPPWEPPFRVPEVVLCGNHYGETFPGTIEREAVVRALASAGIDVGVVGSGWPEGWPVAGQCGVKQQYHIWTRAKVALNVNHFNQIHRYYSDRQLIAMASGTPTVAWWIPGLAEEFKIGVHCAMASSPEDFVALVQELLADPGKRAELGRQGRSEIIKNHTWFSRILGVLPELEKI
jgi:glycosyltransferase involved in cell wall biosynthesis